MTSHPEFVDLAAASIDFELSSDERSRLDAHLATCPACQRIVAGMRADARGIEALPRPVIPERRAALVLAGAIDQQRRMQPLRLAFVVALVALLALAALLGAGTVLRQLDHRAVTAVVTSSPGPTVWPTATSPLRTALPSVVVTAAPNSWTALPSLVNPRTDAGAFLAGGDVVVIGGHASGPSGQVLSSNEGYSPTADRWFALDGLHVACARYAGATSASGSAVLITGGVDATGHALAVAEWFDRGLNQMGRLPDMHVARADHAAVVMTDGRFLIVGGYDDGGRVLASAEIYDPGTGWTTTGSMHDARAKMTATVLSDGRILVAGGIGTSGKSLATAELYDPATGKWSRTGSMTHDRRLQSAVLLADGKVVVAGGYDSVGTPVDSIDLFDPGTGTFSGMGSGPARFQMLAVALPSGRVLFIGGTDAKGNPSKSVDIFDEHGINVTYPRPDFVYDTAAADLLVARTRVMGVVLPDGRVLVVSGDAGAGEVVTDVEAYAP